MPTQEIQNQNSKNLRREGEKGILIKRNDQWNNIRKYSVTEEHVSVEFLAQWMNRDRHQSSWSDFRTPETEVRASREKAETTFKKRELQTQDARRVEQCLYYSERKCLALSYLPTQTINWMWVNKFCQTSKFSKNHLPSLICSTKWVSTVKEGKIFRKWSTQSGEEDPEWQICAGPGEQSVYVPGTEASEPASNLICLPLLICFSLKWEFDF